MIVVTGGAGFIGSCLLWKLEEEGYRDIAIIDVLGNDEKWKNIAKRNHLKYIVQPKDTFDFLEKSKDNIDAIIHMGAISSTTETNADLIIETNVNLSWKLWSFCRDNRKQFIYASSAATYGDGNNGFDDNESLEYLNSLKPLNCYGYSKALFDKIVFNEAQKQDKNKIPPKYVGLKFFNVYGPNEYHKGSQKSVIAHIFPNIKNQGIAKLFKSYKENYKNGEQKRDFIYVKDVVNVICLFLKAENYSLVNGLYNLGTGVARSFNDLTNSTFFALDKKPNIEYIDMPETLKSKYQYYTQANMKKINNLFNNYSFYSLEEGIKDYVQNYLNREDMYL